VVCPCTWTKADAGSDGRLTAAEMRLLVSIEGKTKDRTRLKMLHERKKMKEWR
jgi:hypothetical protein